MIPRTLLIACGPFEKLSAQGVASAISRGLAGRGVPADECPLESGGDSQADVRALLEALHFDERMRCSRAVVLAEWILEERTLAGSPAFEIATRARQAGVQLPISTATTDQRKRRLVASQCPVAPDGYSTPLERL